MKTVGIIAEFNPFHTGHKYLIEQAKALTGANTSVIIMSGDFVQRGAPGVCNKYLRTEMALKGGADIVFELPVIYSLGSAESFAEGAVKLLLSTNSIDYLCFGSESGDTEALIKCASIIEEYTATDKFKDDLSGYIKSGISYPSAFSTALNDALGSLVSLLYTPNNLLGIEYIRALLRLKKQAESLASNKGTSLAGTVHFPEIVAVKRIGSDHLDETISDYSSATAIRDYLSSTPDFSALDISGLSKTLSDSTYSIIYKNLGQKLPIVEDDLSSMLYMRLNTLSDEELLTVPDINPDLLNKLINFKGKKVSFPELIMNLKSKCFTYTAISRALCRILLCPFYSKAYDMLNKISESYVPYLRVLGFRKESSEYLRGLRYSEDINIITKPADGPLDNPSYALDIYASNLYEQSCYNKYKTGFTEELKTGPVII